MNLKEAASLMCLSRERTLKLILEGIELRGAGNLRLRAEHRGGKEYEIEDKDLEAFLEKLESEYPGRWPPVAVRRELLVEVGYKCAICRSDAPLQFQHIIEWSEIKHHDTKHMMAICGVCHDKITRHGSPDIIAQYDIKKKYSKGEPAEEDISPQKKIPLTNPLASCDDEVVDKSDYPRIVYLLPRGFVLLENIEWKEYDSWAVTASYFHYGEGWRYGTHYHESYGSEWNENVQYDKMNVPLGDRRYARQALEIMRSLREVRRKDVKDYIVSKATAGSPLVYLSANELLIPAKLPREKGIEGVYPLNHDVRDLSAEFNQYRYVDLDADGQQLQIAHDDAVSLRLRSILLINHILGKSSPAIELYKETAAEYKNTMTGKELSDWMKRLHRLFLEACVWSA